MKLSCSCLGLDTGDEGHLGAAIFAAQVNLSDNANKRGTFMTMKHRELFATFVVLFAGMIASTCAIAGENSKPAPLMIQEQGSFAVGGTVISNPGTFDPYKMTPEGQTFHGDHAYVFYQIPVNARKLPLMFLHGAGQFSKTWESTPDGREGFQNMFLRRGFGVYVVDQPRRGDAGRSTLPITITPTPDEQVWFNIFRLGIWPDFFPGVQFPRDPEALNQYFRQMTPNTGPFDGGDLGRGCRAVQQSRAGDSRHPFARRRPGLDHRHQEPKCPRHRRLRTRKQFHFPEGEVPPPMPSSAGPLEARAYRCRIHAAHEDPDRHLLRRQYSRTPSANPGQDKWRVRLAMARLWADAVNRQGGDVTVVHLPEIGIRGNTHFPFSDLNNVDIRTCCPNGSRRRDWIKGS